MSNPIGGTGVPLTTEQVPLSRARTCAAQLSTADLLASRLRRSRICRDGPAGPLGEIGEAVSVRFQGDLRPEEGVGFPRTRPTIFQADQEHQAGGRAVIAGELDAAVGRIAEVAAE